MIYSLKKILFTIIRQQISQFIPTSFIFLQKKLSSPQIKEKAAYFKVSCLSNFLF